MNDRRDLTTGSVGKKLIVFALPIFAVNLLQAVYNLVDMVIVGQFIGSTGMTAVSIGGQVTHLVLMACMGLANGSSAYLGQLFGAKKMDDAKRIIGSLLSFLVLLALVLTAVTLGLYRPLLTALRTPEDSFAGAENYLLICISGTVFIYIYNVLSAALRGIGESFTPMLYVLITTLENIGLDLLFVAVLRLGPGGAAAATVISQFTSMCLVIYYVKRKTELFDFAPASFRIDRKALRSLLKIGLPQSIQFVCTNISFLLISSLINTYGTAAAAAAGASNKIWNFAMMPGMSFMTAIISLTAQNHPAGHFRRILQGLTCAVAVSLGFTAVMLALCQLTPAGMYRLFTGEAEVARIGAGYLRLYSLSFLTETVMFCIFGVLTGSGYTTVTMVSAVTSAFGVRYVAAYFLSAYTALGFNGIALAYSLAPLVGICLGGFFLLSGKWKVSRIRV